MMISTTTLNSNNSGEPASSTVNGSCGPKPISQQSLQSSGGGHVHSHHHHHHHHSHSQHQQHNKNHSVGRNSVGDQSNAILLHGPPEFFCESTVDEVIDSNPLYSNLSHSRDALNEPAPTLLHVDPMTQTNASIHPLDGVAQQNPPATAMFNLSGREVVKQPVAKTNSDSGVMEASGTGAVMSTGRIYSSRDTKLSSRGQRLHRTIPRHFTTTVASASGTDATYPLSLPSSAYPTATAGASSSSSSTKDKPRDSTLKRNKSEKMMSTTQNKKPVCQCPVQHVPRTYMGTTTLATNQLLGSSNVTGHHHHKSMLNVAKQQQQQLTLEPAKGFDDELKLITNSLRRIRTKVPEGNGCEGGKPISTMDDLKVKIPTISKQVLNAEKEKGVIGGIGMGDGQEHQLQSILKHSQMSKSTSRLAATTGAMTNATTAIHPPPPTADSNASLISSPPFPIEMIESLNVAQQQPQSTSVAVNNSDQNPALPPKMYKTNRQTFGTAANGNIHTISKSSRLGFVQYQPQAVSGAGASGYTPQRGGGAAAEKQMNKLTGMSYPSSSMGHISYNLINKSEAEGGVSAGVSCPLSTAVPKPPMEFSCQKSQNLSSGRNGTKEAMLSNKPGCSKAEALHYNHQQHHQYHHNNTSSQPNPQPKYSAKVRKGQESQHPQENNINVAMGGESEKPLPVCTTSKNCSNPREHFMPNEASLDDDYLSECENCKSVCGSRYYLEEKTPESPQETMTLQRKMPEASELEEQTYYRTSTTLPTNTKQKNNA